MKTNDWKDTLLKTAGQLALDSVRLGTAGVVSQVIQKKAGKLLGLDDEEKKKKQTPDTDITALLDED